VLSWVFVSVTHLTGTGSEEVMYLTTTDGPPLNVTGLLLAGIIIGSLGALNDATVTQASAVWELHATTSDPNAGRLYRSGMRIGRDHIASTVYTIVLAYAGAALPLLLLFTMTHADVGDVANSEIVAEEIVRTLVGSIGLVASVPITTLIAALVVTADRAPGAAPPDGIAPAAGDDDDAPAPVAPARALVDATSARVKARLARSRSRREAAREIESRRPKQPDFDLGEW
jgi:uncharacterized membrane protein